MRLPLSLICATAVSALIAAPAGFAAPTTPLFLQNPDGGSVRALIIGIDAYQHVRPLKGSVADAKDIEGSLRSMGTPDVTTLIDGQATRTNVLQKISDLVQRTKANDLIILSIAGHFGIKAMFFYVLAPLATRLKPICLDAKSVG